MNSKLYSMNSILTFVFPLSRWDRAVGTVRVIICGSDANCIHGVQGGRQQGADKYPPPLKHFIMTEVNLTGR